MRYNNPCSKEECPICRPEMVKSGSNDNHGDKNGETDGDGDRGHDDHDYGDNDGDDESDSDDGEDGEDDNDDEGDKAGPSHTSHVYHKYHRYETRQSSTLAICPIPRPTARKASARKASARKVSALDNKSVPYRVHMEEYHGKRANGKMAGPAIYQETQWPNYNHRGFLTLYHQLTPPWGGPYSLLQLEKTLSIFASIYRWGASSHSSISSLILRLLLARSAMSSLSDA